MSKAITVNLKDLSRLGNKPVVVLPLAEYERLRRAARPTGSNRLRTALAASQSINYDGALDDTSEDIYSLSDGKATKR